MSAPGGAEHCSDGEFTMLTMNLRFGLAEDGPNSWVNRRDAVGDLLLSLSPDLIFLQEANDFQIAELHHRLVGYRYIGGRKPAPRFWQNNVIFYGVPWTCTLHDHFYLSPTPRIPSRFAESRWPRQCTIGDFQKADRRIRCINTHFDFSPSVQVRSAEVILHRIAELPAAPSTILAGDFNATPASPGHEMFTNSQHLGENRFSNAFSAPYPATHHGFTGSRHGDHIDWVLFRGKLFPVKCSVLWDKVRGLYPSDHFPLFCRFAWMDG